MNNLIDLMPILALAAIVVPFLGALLIVVLPRRAAQPVSIGAAALSLLFCILVSSGFWFNGKLSTSYSLIAYGDMSLIGLIFDKLSTLLAPAFVGIGLLVLVYSVSYLSEANREHADIARRRFYALLLSFIGAMAGLAYASTIVTQLVFFEITGACSWALIGYYETEQSQKAANKALVLTHIASLGMFVATALMFCNLGSLDLADLSKLGATEKSIVMLCIMFAAWGKSAQLPLYMWLPSAMAAPTPVSAYLHGGSMVKVGVAVLARAVLCAGTVDPVVAWVGIVGAMLTLIFSFIEYLPQTDMKRLLAFSTISQLSYIFLALSIAMLGSQAAYEGGVSHIFNHAFAKTLFFLVAGCLSYTMGTRNLSKIKGLIKKQPLVGLAFIIAALAVAGVPPFSGFFSKFLIFQGGFSLAYDSLALFVLMCLLAAETVACFAWFLLWINRSVLGETNDLVASASPVPTSMKIVFVVLGIMAVASSAIASIWLA